MKRLLLVSLCLSLALSGALLLILVAGSGEDDTEEPNGRNDTAERPVTKVQHQPRKPAVSLTRKADIRGQINRIIRREAEPLGQARGQRQLDAYLARLEARARAKGKVTALEVEPGLAAIRAHQPGKPGAMARMAAYSSRMVRLSAELSGKSPRTPRMMTATEPRVMRPGAR